MGEPPRWYFIPKPNYISLIYHGSKFGLDDLIQSTQRGSGAEIRALRDTAGGSLELNYRYRKGRNEWLILEYPESAHLKTRVGVWAHPKGSEDSFSVTEDCYEIHVYGDEFLSFSDLHWPVQFLKHLKMRKFVVHGIYPIHSLADELRRLLPHVRFTRPVDIP